MIALFVVALPTFVCTQAGDGGPSVAWAAPREIVLSRSGGGAEVSQAEVAEALARAAAAWTDVECSDVVVRLGPPTRQRVAGFDWSKGTASPENENIVVFKNNEEGDATDTWTHILTALAVTTVTFDTATGRVLDADIEVNDATFTFTACDPGTPGCVVRFDLQNTLTHEIGHLLGLDHPVPTEPGALEATMFEAANQGDVDKRDLAADDIAALCFIYPPGEEAGNCYDIPRRDPPSIVISQVGCASSAAPVGAVGLVALGVLVVRHGRRRSGRQRSAV